MRCHACGKELAFETAECPFCGGSARGSFLGRLLRRLHPGALLGSLIGAQLDGLVKTWEARLPRPATEGPFRMAVAKAVLILGRGALAHGKIGAGEVRLGQELGVSGRRGLRRGRVALVLSRSEVRDVARGDGEEIVLVLLGEGGRTLEAGDTLSS